MATRNIKYFKAKDTQVLTQVNLPVEKVKQTQDTSIKKAEIIQKLTKEKEELEQEFTQILEFILGDMKKQEEFISKSLNERDATNEMVAQYKKQYTQAQKQIKELEEQNKRLQKRVHSLENSTLGKITIMYWKWRKRKNT